MSHTFIKPSLGCVRRCAVFNVVHACASVYPLQQEVNYVNLFLCRYFNPLPKFTSPMEIAQKVQF
jgi:hypothetical protein